MATVLQHKAFKSPEARWLMETANFWYDAAERAHKMGFEWGKEACLIEGHRARQAATAAEAMLASIATLGTPPARG